MVNPGAHTGDALALLPHAPPRAAARTEVEASASVGGKGLTTLLLRDLPPSLSRDALVALLLAEGFQLDFAYVPCQLATGVPFGYAFVNLTTAAEAVRCWRRLEGFSAWRGAAFEGDAACKVAWAMTQGLHSNVKRYRNSPLMHAGVSETMRPILLRKGRPVPFPPPTKLVKPPRLQSRRFWG